MFAQIKLYIALGCIVGILIGDVWIGVHFYRAGIAHEKAKVQREINSAIRKGDDAKASALRDFDALPDDGGDASGVPNDGFQRP